MFFYKFTRPWCNDLNWGQNIHLGFLRFSRKITKIRICLAFWPRHRQVALTFMKLGGETFRVQDLMLHNRVSTGIWNFFVAELEVHSPWFFHALLRRINSYYWLMYCNVDYISSVLIFLYANIFIWCSLSVGITHFTDCFQNSGKRILAQTEAIRWL